MQEPGTGAPRLRDVSLLPREVAPSYDPAAHGNGIAHIGLGAFHRAHQALYTDEALAAGGGDWRIIGINPRATGIVDTLNAQNGLYTLLIRGPEGTRARVIASIAEAVAAAREPERALAALADPKVRIVSLTVTEKGYGIDRATVRIDPNAPAGPLGMIAQALDLRRRAGTAPFTVLCCDNLPDNGKLIRSATLDHAGRRDPALRDWIEAGVSFPSTMVDGITPAPTDATLADAERLTGFGDLAAVEAEPYTQWVMEDRFPQGRPAWEAGGALFVDDVAPYERMKLRMLNGTHSLIAYAGFLSGCTYVRDAMAWPALARLVERNFAAAAATLSLLPGIDFADHARQLAERFRNPEIAHETYQIAMDGTEKLPQRHFQPAVEVLDRGGDVASFAFTVAAWMAYCASSRRAGAPYALRDPREAEIEAAVAGAGSDPASLSAALHDLPGLLPERLKADPAWREAVEARLADMLARGMRAAVEDEARAG